MVIVGDISGHKGITLRHLNKIFCICMNTQTGIFDFLNRIFICGRVPKDYIEPP